MNASGEEQDFFREDLKHDNENNAHIFVQSPSQDREETSPFGANVLESLGLKDGFITTASSPTPTPSPCPTTIVVDQQRQSMSQTGQEEPWSEQLQHQTLQAPGSMSACNTPIPRRDTPCSSSRFSNQAVYTPSPSSNVASSARITLNPLFESASFVKKKIMIKLKSLRGEDPDEDAEDEAHETKSLSIDSYYITPTTVNEEEAAEKLIQATNYFIVSALVASFILALLILWLLSGTGKSSFSKYNLSLISHSLTLPYIFPTHNPE